MSQKTFVAIRVTNKITQSTIKTGTLCVLKGNCIQSWSRDAWQSSENWPSEPVWQNDDLSEDIDCEILKVDTKVACDEEVEKELAKLKPASLDSSQLVSKADYDSLKSKNESLQQQVDDLKSEMENLWFALKSWQKACTPYFFIQSKLIQVSNWKGWYISIRELTFCLQQGMTNSGFMKLVAGHFSLVMLSKKSWTKLSLTHREKIEDLLGLFVLYGVCFEHKGNYTASVAQNIFESILSQFKTKLNQTIYREKNPSTNTRDASNKRLKNSQGQTTPTTALNSQRIRNFNVKTSTPYMGLERAELGARLSGNTFNYPLNNITPNPNERVQSSAMELISASEKSNQEACQSVDVHPSSEESNMCYFQAEFGPTYGTNSITQVSPEEMDQYLREHPPSDDVHPQFFSLSDKTA